MALEIICVPLQSMMEEKARRKLERLQSKGPDCVVTGTDDEKNRDQVDSHSEIRYGCRICDTNFR